MAIIKYIFFYLFYLDFMIEEPSVAVFSSLFCPLFHIIFLLFPIFFILND